MDPRRWSFTRQTLAVLVLLVAAVLVVAFGGSAVVLQRQASDDAGRIAVSVARAVAEDDVVRAGAAAASAAAAPETAADRAALADGPVQEAAEEARVRTGALFVVVTDDRGLRLAHPEPERLGLLVSSDPSVPLAGGEVVEYGTGTLGEAARAKVPVYAPGSAQVVGEVSVGVPGVEVDRLARDATLLAAGTAVLALLGGVAGAVLLARRLRRLTHGVEPEELGALLQGHEAVLFGIGDGVVAVGPDGRVVLANEEAVRLLGRSVGAGDTTGAWPAALRSLVEDPDPTPSLLVLGDRALLCSSRRVVRDGRALGVVLTLRDRTDVELLARQLDAVAEAGTVLRAQRHEFANRLHLVAGLLDSGATEEAGEYVHTLLGTGPLGTAVEGLDAVRDPYLQAFVAAKAAHAREGGVQLRLGGAAVRSRLADPVDVTTVLGNLVDNAVTALAGREDGVVELDLVQDGDTLVVAVADNGPGVPAELASQVFETGVTSRASGEGGIGLGLVQQVARARGGTARLASAGGAGELGGAVFVVELPGVVEGEG